MFVNIRGGYFYILYFISEGPKLWRVSTCTSTCYKSAAKTSDNSPSRSQTGDRYRKWTESWSRFWWWSSESDTTGFCLSLEGLNGIVVGEEVKSAGMAHIWSVELSAAAVPPE